MAGIYLHIPFCKQACSYCNFHFSTLLKYKEDVLQAMLLEIARQQDFFIEKTNINTIYFGGGTPSILSAGDINRLLAQIHKYFDVQVDAEITLEANPDDLTLEYLLALKKETPINRFSIGIQSFVDADLQYMHRAHNAAQAKACVEHAQHVGFHNLSVDLIYGTPTLNATQCLQNIQTVIDLQVPHVSCYALTVEEKTELASLIKKRKKEAPTDEAMTAQFDILTAQMRAHHYIHYEISNFGKEGHFAQHNTNYWKGIPYLGIGPSAHSFDGQKRYWNIANNAIYLKKIKTNEAHFDSELLTETDKYNEYIMTSIRTIFGVDIRKLQHDFEEKYVQHFLREIKLFKTKNWIEENNGIYRLTDKGKLFCDHISAHLFIEN
ncbi:MAG: radical SAM family heme chaperone HemW [Chitinophagales bacterium]